MKTNRFAQIAVAAGIALTASLPTFAAPAASLQESAPAAAERTTGSEAPRQAREPGELRHHDHKRGDHRHHRAHMKGGMMLHGITLTDEQKTKIGELRKASAPQVRESMKQAFEARKALRELTLSGNFDEARANTLAQQGADAMARGSVVKAKTDSQVLALLTPEQRKEVAENAERMKERMQERKERMKERRDGKPGTPAAQAAPAQAAPAAATPAAQ